MSPQSRLSVNDKGDDMMILRAVHKSLSICLTAEENPKKTSARRPSDEGSANSHNLKWGPILLNEVSRIAKHVSKGEGRKERNEKSGVLD